MELCLYDNRKWYNPFSVFNTSSLAIRYNQEYYIIFKGSHIRKVKASKISSKITYCHKKEISCKSILVSRIWIDNILNRSIEFKNAKSFVKLYIKIVSIGKE